MQKNYDPADQHWLHFKRTQVSTSVIIRRISISSNFQYRCNIAPFHDFMDCLIELTKQGHIKL